MAEYRLGEVEMQFAEIIWGNEPLLSRDLAKLCEEKLDWKKSTTYTILRRVCDRGLFQNENGTVVSLVSKEEFLAKRSEIFVEDTFEGSLPKFVAAFTSNRKLSAQDIEELQRIIEQSK